MLQIGEQSNVTKAQFKIEGETTPIDVQFNPDQFNFSEEAQYSNGSYWYSSNEKQQYTGSKKKTFAVTLYFDTAGAIDIDGNVQTNGSVKNKTDQIENLAKITGNKHRPPEVTFLWGDIQFTGFVTTVKTSFTLFSPEGSPLRAKVDVTMQEKNIDKEANPLESPDRTKTRVLSEDISIWSLAQLEYGDIKEWRRIAKANSILNPFEVETGRILVVPAIVDED